MSNQITRRMIRAYLQEAMPQMFLASFFVSPPENFHNSEEVEIDITRTEEDIATVITDLSTGSAVNSFDGYTNKSFKPPIYDETGTINSFDLIKRMQGEDPFQDVNFQANATRRSFAILRKLEAKVRRAVELQASQVFQTGMLTLSDAAGNAAYTLDYKPKSTHFPTVSTGWDQAGSTKLADLEDLAEVLRTDGLSNPNTLVFGLKAWREFINDEAVQERLNSRRGITAEVMPQGRGEGATFQGYIWLGNYRFEMWTYNGRYRNRTNNTSVNYLTDDKIIMLDDQARLDLTFGAIPLIPRPGPSLEFLPNRITTTDGGFGMTTNSWVEGSGKALYVSAGTRPLCIPTAIDKIGCLDTNIA